jgi:CBS domain-containing protein
LAGESTLSEDKDTIKEVMTRTVFTLSPKNKTIDALNLMVKNDIGAVVVVDEGKVVGIITERDIVREITKSFDYLDRKLAETGKRAVITASLNTPLWEAFAILLKNRIRRLPVVKDEKLLGIVTERDLFKWAVKVAYEPNIPDDLRKLIAQNP